MLNSGQNGRFFAPCDLKIWWITLKNNRAPLLCCFKLCASFHSHRWIQTKVTVRKRSIWSKSAIYCPMWPSNLMDDLEKQQGTSSTLLQACASFHNHRWILTKVTVWKRSIRVKIGDFLSRMSLKFDEWPWKTIGHLFYATSSFMHHFVAIGEFKLELHSGNAQFRSKSTIFRAVWPWNLMDALEKQ